MTTLRRLVEGLITAVLIGSTIAFLISFLSGGAIVPPFLPFLESSGFGNVDDAYAQFDRASGDEPTFTADGGSIVYVTWTDDGGRILRRTEIESGATSDLIAADEITGPDVSPDGKRVAYALDPDRRADLAWAGHNDARELAADPILPTLQVVDLAGGDPVTLVEGSDGGIHPSWSPDGGRIAYTCDIGADGGNLCIVDVASGSVTRVLDTPAMPEGQPTWSPDGGRISFASDRGHGWAIHAVDVATGQVDELFDGTDGLGIGDPAWSPDGETIATSPGELSEDGGICLRALDGSPTCFAGGPSGDWAPDWAADGRLAFNAYLFDVEFDLMLLLDPGDGTTSWLVPGSGLQEVPEEP